MTVYFIKRKGTDGPVKIGYTDDLHERLINLRTATPEGLDVLCTISGGRELEAYLHSAFEHSRVGAEWFEMSADLLTLIGLLQRQGVAALAAGTSGQKEHTEREKLNDQADVLLANKLLRRCVEPVPAGALVKQQLRIAMRRLGWSYGRVFSIWYGDARRIAAWEMRQLHEVANQRWVESHSAAEIAALRRRIEELEAKSSEADR